MNYSVIPTPDGRFQITHATIRMNGDWTFDSESDARRVLREMALDTAWARHEAAKADLAWDQYEREYGDE